MGQFERLLAYIKGMSRNTSEQGTWFENFMKHVFLTSPIYKEMYENVWTWTEFPYNGGRHDYGIDLVAKARNIDEYYAIQCKFYDDEHSVSKSDVDTFLTASGKPFYIKGTPVRYAGRVIVSTTDKWSSTANDIIEGQIPAVSRIRLKDLKEIGIDWDSVSVDNPSSMKQSKKKVVRPHQKTAIVDVLEGFKTADRGKLIMACGTGKTYTALKIVEEITKGDGNVLFLVPSISLLNQTLLEWTKECNYDYQVYAICSDPKVTKSSKETVDNLADTIVPATTNVESLVDGYTNLWNALGKKGIRFFFSTYQSIDVISKFQKIVLTDTFALSENIDEDTGKPLNRDSFLFHQNSERATKQLETDITVIVGNPPYSVGQKSGNDNNQNVAYEHLDSKLARTYVAKSKATLTRNAYDTYIKAFRWATDRIGDNGVVGFVSNGAYLDSVALDGFRQCLVEEFNSVYVFNLRGNQRTSGELSRKEGGKIFGSGSRTPVAITVLVKKKGVKKDGYVRYYDIGDYLSRTDKLNTISHFESIKNIPWKYLTPNDNNDWLNQRNPNFMNFIALERV